MTSSFKNHLESLGPEKHAWLAGLNQAESSLQLDKRVRSKSKSPDYTPPPPAPTIKIEMVERDLMEHVGECLQKPVNTIKRKTLAGNEVYRVSLDARDEIETFLEVILPYVVGNKTRSKIEILLKACDEHAKWVADGGPSKLGKLANKASQAAKKAKKDKKANENDQKT